MDLLWTGMDWFAENWTSLALILTTIAALTPTQHDDAVVGRVVNLIGRLMVAFKGRDQAPK